MIKKNIKLILLSSLFYTQLSLHAFSMDSNIDYFNKGPVMSKLIEHAREKDVEVTAAKKSDPINSNTNIKTVFVKNSQNDEIKLLYIQASDLSKFIEGLPSFTRPIQFK